MSTTREQIIEKTCELIELQGFNATGVNQIIRESATPKGSLYYHFPGGKEELAVDAIKHVGAIVLRRIRENLSNVKDPAKAIEEFVKNIALNVELSGFRSGGPITTIAMETASTNDTLRDTCQNIYTEWQNAFAEKMIEGGMNSVRAKRLAVLIIASIEGGVILCRTKQSKEPLEQIAEELYISIAQSS